MAEESTKKGGDVEYIVSRDLQEMTVTRTRKIPLAVMPVTPFGKYNLIGKLGHGGMAEVFLAYVAGPAGFRKLCVIKRLHQQLEEEPGFLDMFLDEARLAARLNHPNIVQCFEVGDVDDSHFIAMEYLEGQGLDRLRRYCLREGLTIPGPLVARMVVDALDGLHYAHELKDFDGSPLGIVHRDISPQNVFVTYDGVVKLLDFGIAKATTHVVETRTGTVKGKFAYMAPEQARGKEVDHRADLWSMGVVLWETLSNTRLFKGPNDLATLNQSLMGEIPNIRNLAQDTSDSLVRITHKALSREITDRYRSAHEMKVDLEQSISAEPGGLASRSDVAEFMRGLFSEVIDQQQKVLQICLSDSPTVGADGRPLNTMGTPPDLRVTPQGVVTQSASEQMGTPTSQSPLPQVSVTPSTETTPSGPISPYAVNTPSSSQSALYPYAPQGGSGWIGKLAILLGAVILAVLSTIIVLWLYGPQSPETIMVFNEPQRGESQRPTPPAAQEAAAPAPVEPPPAPPPRAQVSPPDLSTSNQVEAHNGQQEGQDQPTGEGEAEAVEPAEPRVSKSHHPVKRGSSRRSSERASSGKSRPVVAKATDVNPTPEEPQVGTSQGSSSQDGSEPTQETPAARREAEEFGFLTLDTMPWSRVSVSGRSLGITPVIRAKLPPGTHVVTLRNPEQGISTTYRVRIQAGQTTSKRLGLR